MFSSLNIFKTASALAAHAATRQTAITRNIANADTPGYRAMDIASFSDVFSGGSETPAMRATRVGHLSEGTGTGNMNFTEISRPGNESPNGNSVSLETEMVKAAEVKFSHDLALTVYSSGLTVLRTSLGGR